jgi:hypothetical protein
MSWGVLRVAMAHILFLCGMSSPRGGDIPIKQSGIPIKDVGNDFKKKSWKKYTSFPFPLPSSP